MPVYVYEASRAGKFVQGTLKAQSVQMAGMKLRSRNLDPIHIAKKPAIAFFAGGQGFKTREVLIFTRQMAFLISSGVSVLRALNIALTMTDSSGFKGHIKDLMRAVERGESLSDALGKKPAIFKGFYVNMVVCAEETGLLDKTLQDLAVYMEKSESIKSKVKSAMMYPAVVLSISIGIISAIIMFIVPRFEELYKGADSGLPALTQVFVNLSHLMRDNWYILLGALIVMVVGAIQYAKTETGKQQITSFVSTLPLFGQLQFQSGLARFCRAFFSLSRSGVNMMEALDISGNIAEHKDIRYGLQQAKLAVSQGKPFAQGLAKSQVFPSLVINMTKVGEESGQIEKSFEKLTYYYEEELENKIAGLVKLIEPMMIVILGGIIGTIILALYLPVFKLGDII